MGCPQIPELDYAQLSKIIHEDAGERNIPINGAIDITSSCNLRCVHCYIRDTDCGQELSFKEICEIFDQIADAGCLWLCITGGEPLIRPDFRDIYSYAKRKGFLITLFTNGTLLTPSLADFLADEPPFVIDISLYGVTEGTYEKVTGVRGSYRHCMNGIELALERRLPLKLKTIIMTLNANEFHDMRRYAKNLGVPFRHDALINPRIDGSLEPTRYRLTPEEIVSLELEDPELADEISKVYIELYGIRGKREKLYNCGAGRGMFHITSDGKLNICTIASEPGYDLRTGNFNTGFYDVFPEVLKKMRTRVSECQSCAAANMCGQCPAWAELENGDPEAKIEFLCQTARLRVDAFVKRNNLIFK